jgi:hypothetical protein
MADRIGEHQQIVRATDEHAAEAPLPNTLGVPRWRRSGRPEHSPHSHKFLAATAAMVGIAAGALVVALAILLSGNRAGPAPKWSSWSPPDGGITGEREIANQVAPFYRASPATQLVVVTVQNISGSSNGGMQLALRDPSSGSLSAVRGHSAVYNLCGLGPNCAIATGTPSAARLLLLRREALELALYTLKYIGGVDNVVAILPPGRSSSTAQLTPKPPSPGKTATSSQVNMAVVFQHQGLQRFLDRPLRETLPEPLPPTVSQMQGAPEAELVDVITGQGLFSHQLVQSQDGSSVLVLNPQPPQ